MKIYRLIWTREIPTGRLVKYFSVCVAVSCLLFVACQIFLTTTWLPHVRSLSPDNDIPFSFTGRRGKILRPAWASSRNFDKSPIYKQEWVQVVKSHPQFLNKRHEKWKITFITDDSDRSLTRRKFERQLKTDTELGGIHELDEKHFKQRGKEKQWPIDDSSKVSNESAIKYMPSIRYTKRRESVSNPFKVVGKPLTFKTSRTPQQKTILLWTTFFGKTDWLSSDKLENCSIPGWSDTNPQPACRITSNKSDLHTSDLIVMHANDLQSSLDLPTYRSAYQRWMFYCQESPKHMYLDLANFTGLFNYTCLIRRDADYVIRHGEAIPKDKHMRLQRYKYKMSQIMALKTRLVVARISNCGPLERLKYIEELRKFVDVDFFGACGDQECPKSDEKCNSSKMAAYKFYLAFENSRCKDYITEKFWLPLHHWNSVPVVMGGSGPGDYRDVAPPHSYINTADFSSPRHLAEHLLLLDKNQTLYEEYFRWRRFYGNRRQKDDTWCRVCADLHNITNLPQYYTDLKGWYRQDSCVATLK